MEPANNEARLELGRMLYETNDLQGSITETAKILESDPKHVDALYNLGAIYANLNKQDMARPVSGLAPSRAMRLQRVANALERACRSWGRRWPSRAAWTSTGPGALTGQPEACRTFNDRRDRNRRCRRRGAALRR